MKVTLFGATGKTGPSLIREGLRRGYDIRVFARDGSHFEHKDVHVIRGDITDIERLRTAIRGADAVISALGPTRLRHPGDLPITRATKAILSAMEHEHVTRLMAVSTGTAVDPGDGFDTKIRWPAAFIKLAMPAAHADIVGLAKLVRSSGCNWTMVRIGFLRDRPPSERLNVGLYGRVRHSWTLGRDDLAQFMFDQITSREFERCAPGISSASV